jgi:hypothetical protein
MILSICCLDPTCQQFPAVFVGGDEEEDGSKQQETEQGRYKQVKAEGRRCDEK